MRINYCLKSILCALLFYVVGSTSSVILAQQKEKKENLPGFPGKNSCANARRAEFDIKCKDRYFFGESPTITISITNTSRKTRTVKEAEHQKFALELFGVFQNNTGQERKATAYDGGWDIPKEPTRFPSPGESHIWQSAKKREPKFITLAPDESTLLTLDLSETFNSYLGVGKYRLLVKSEDGKKVVREFEVYFDEQKSATFLTAFIKSGEALDGLLADKKYSYFRRTFSTGESSRIWALYRFAEFDKKGLVVLLEGLAKSGNEDQRNFASNVLNRIKAGKPLT